MLLLDLDRLEELDARLRLFSLLRFNLWSFDPRRHGDGSDVPLKDQVAARLVKAEIAAPGLRVSLLTMPRLLGFAFNPISIYFCADTAGRLVAVLYEVNNTFGERHSYLLEAKVEPGAPIQQTAPKSFHVSPFMAMDQHYNFRLTPPDDRLGLAITSRDAAGPMLSAVLDLKRRDLSDAALIRTFAAMPLMTLKVVAGIGWDALKLWLKGVPVFHKPPPPAQAITVVRTAS